ncbi:MAG: hypothetical protein WCT54_02695 [Patescibacteria group bacterium]|jgi:hypothetical protein
MTETEKATDKFSEADFLDLYHGFEDSRFLIHLNSGERLMGSIYQADVVPGNPSQLNRISISRSGVPLNDEGRPCVCVEICFSSIKNIERVIDIESRSVLSPHSD